jgi:hypothetical protein
MIIFEGTQVDSLKLDLPGWWVSDPKKLEPYRIPRSCIDPHRIIAQSGKIISINSMKVAFWGVKCSDTENSEVKCSKILQKKLSVTRKSCKIYVKTAENQNYPALNFHFPAEMFLPLKFYYTTDVVSGF